MRFTVALLVALAATTNARAAEFTLTVATVAPADSPWAALLQKYEKAVEEKSKGRIDVKVKLGGVLGDELETVTKTRRGQIQGVGASTGALASVVPELNVIEMPFLFRTTEEADHIIDNVLTKPLEEVFKKRGLILAFWSENGYRSFGSRDFAIRKPADLKGKRMRTQESPVHMAMYKALGAAAVPIPTTEVPQALATGNVDGFDQSALYAIAASWYKSAKHWTVSEHIYQPAIIAMNAEWFNTLPADLQKLLIEEGRAVQTKGRKAVRQIQNDLYEIFKANKVEVYTLTPEERVAFANAVKPVYAEMRKTLGAESAKLLDAAEKGLKELRGAK